MIQQELIDNIMLELFTYHSFSRYTETEYKILESNIKELLGEYFKNANL